MITPTLSAAEANGEPILFDVGEDNLLTVRLRDEGEPVLRFGHSAEAGAICGHGLLKLAALCLHGRISWEMVDALRAARVIERWENVVDEHETAIVGSVADLLESLLPPRKPSLTELSPEARKNLAAIYREPMDGLEYFPPEEP